MWNRRFLADLGGVQVPFAALEDLIRMKRAAGRPKDLEDLAQLEKLKSPGGA
ncbi:MAG TPA: hypothetical protein VJS92_10260 [Candidatus Polarisedimenticolaceae bacterium]|nr:hypothetical protein [Candidatus Polarisedimenticolaceae bacterium]